MSSTSPEGIHPAWNELLTALPESLRPVVTPHLQKWSQNFDTEVTKKVEEAIAPYQPYKVLVDNNVPMERIDETLRFVYTLENDPEGTVKNLIDHFKVELPTANVADNSEDDPFNLDDGEPDMKIEDHPVVKQLLQSTQEFQEKLNAQEQAQQEAQALAQFNKEIDQFLGSKEEYKVIPKELLIAYMSQGATTEQAAESIMGMVKSQITPPPANQTPAPVVMGGDGAAGSGLPNTDINVGTLAKGETTDLVIEMLKAAAAENQQ